MTASSALRSSARRINQRRPLWNFQSTAIPSFFCVCAGKCASFFTSLALQLATYLLEYLHKDHQSMIFSLLRFTRTERAEHADLLLFTIPPKVANKQRISNGSAQAVSWCGRGGNTGDERGRIWWEYICICLLNSNILTF